MKSQIEGLRIWLLTFYAILGFYSKPIIKPWCVIFITLKVSLNVLSGNGITGYYCKICIVGTDMKVFWTFFGCSFTANICFEWQVIVIAPSESHFKVERREWLNWVPKSQFFLFSLQTAILHFCETDIWDLSEEEWENGIFCR